MMFEVENLLEASPATVSRCGMIYMEPSNLHSKNLITSFSNCLDDFYNKPNYILEFNRLANEIFYPALNYWQSLNQALFENSENSVVAGFLRLF
jgi:dynein heavy chain